MLGSCRQCRCTVDFITQEHADRLDYLCEACIEKRRQEDLAWQRLVATLVGRPCWVVHPLHPEPLQARVRYVHHHLEHGERFNRVAATVYRPDAPPMLIQLLQVRRERLPAGTVDAPPLYLFLLPTPIGVPQ